MTDRIQISVDPDVYERLQLLMVPPANDANAVIKDLLDQEGHASPAYLAVDAAKHHFTMEQEYARSLEGVYDCGGNT